MTNPFRALTLLATVLALVLLVAGATPAADKAMPTWVDLDGDGFNDLAEDADQDGIPDFGIKHEVDESAGPDRSGIFADMKVPETKTAVSIDPNSMRFDLRYKMVLGLCATRCELESVFGSGLGSGTQAAGGGGCAGGVCLR